MPMMTFLLLIILVLLIAVIIMMFTVWPRRQRAEMEKAVSALRREMAEHRGDSIRLMQAIRNEVEDTVKESLEHEMTDFFGRGVSKASFHRPVNTAAQQGSKEEIGNNLEENIAATVGPENSAEQMSLFQEQAKSKQQRPSETPEKLEPETVTKETNIEPMERVQAVLHDDIPDIDDIPDLDDVK